MSATQQQELCLSKCACAYKNDADNHLHNYVSAAQSIKLRLWKIDLWNHSRKKRWTALL